jgi:hypothetical protein
MVWDFRQQWKNELRFRSLTRRAMNGREKVLCVGQTLDYTRLDRKINLGLSSHPKGMRKRGTKKRPTSRDDKNTTLRNDLRGRVKIVSSG